MGGREVGSRDPPEPPLDPPLSNYMPYTPYLINEPGREKTYLRSLLPSRT